MAVAGEDPSERPIVRAARPADVPLLLELFGELAEYEHLGHEMRATEELLRRGAVRASARRLRR